MNRKPTHGEQMILIQHGNGVESALAELLEGKTLVHPPFKKLNVAEVKLLVELYSQLHPYNNPCILAGPLDEADPSTLDILLKIIEEPINLAPELILWCHDLGSVPSTIRSRCGEKYHYAPQGVHDLHPVATSLYTHIKGRDELETMLLIKNLEKGSERGLIEAFLDVLVEESDYGLYDSRIRKILNSKRVTKAMLVGFFSEVFI